ncbi:phosphoribosylamine--glycine ligase [Corynebacterium sp. TAE3-ERU12]|uniref:phosphoribosylamine--glycine ligase n=1 Tax=Corynebacterium sp. TAE3-ERU12 TaxID=2849491 RepID=UPI001C485F9F|nr:phosphoribosylamine--glycine ligase [Corynebacterium sp. TAE3-ERU12]MBV7295878.1 phosphoribosylamine--glycine ligase [Corynebacterium sp. TAE3-ERU12]
MRILVLGSGAREHALLNAMQGHQLHVAPGNAGMTALADLHSIDPADADAVVTLAKELNPDLVVIGPEVPLVEGVADALRAADYPVFGPGREAARIEGSKAFAKDVMAAAGVRTAQAQAVHTVAELDSALDNFGPNYVVKDDGLAAGKGVVVTDDRAAAFEHGREVIESGNPVLLESFLDGPEVSLFCLVDGTTVVPLLPAQDHKRVGEGDTGPNTGGMGAYTPLEWLPEGATQQIVDEVCIPVAREMARRGCPFSGLLYAGLAWGAEGPAVVEFNCRFGDPETQAVLALLESPLADALYATATGSLDQLPPLQWRDGYALTVVLAAHGYPASTRTGDPIGGAEPGREADGILHAGTARNDEGDVVSAGGRVLNVVATGQTLEQARERAYETLDTISLPGSHARRDIALPAVEGRITI